MAAAEVKSIQDQKRELIERNERYREAIVAECVQVGTAFSWVPRTIQLARAISPLLLVASPLLGWLARKKLRNGKSRLPQDPEEKKKSRGIFATAWGAFRLYKQIAPFVQGFMNAWPSTRANHPAAHSESAGAASRRQAK